MRRGLRAEASVTSLVLRSLRAGYWLLEDVLSSLDKLSNCRDEVMRQHIELARKRISSIIQKLGEGLEEAEVDFPTRPSYEEIYRDAGSLALEALMRMREAIDIIAANCSPDSLYQVATHLVELGGCARVFSSFLKAYKSIFEEEEPHKFPKLKKALEDVAEDFKVIERKHTSIVESLEKR